MNVITLSNHWRVLAVCLLACLWVLVVQAPLNAQDLTPPETAPPPPEAALPEAVSPEFAPVEDQPQRETPQAWIGVMTFRSPPFLAEQLALPVGQGRVVEHIAPDSPAEKAGVRLNDIIHKIDGRVIGSRRDLNEINAKHQPGDKIEIELIRQGQRLTVALVLAPPPQDMQDQLNQPEVQPLKTVSVAYLGAAAAALSPDLAHHLGLRVDQGVLVAAVEPGGPADQAGLQAHDVLHQFDGEVVTGEQHFRQLVRAREPGQVVALVRYRAGGKQTLQATLVGREVEDRPQQLQRPDHHFHIEPLQWLDRQIGELRDNEHLDWEVWPDRAREFNDQMNQRMQRLQQRMKEMIKKHQGGVRIAPDFDLHFDGPDIEFQIPPGAQAGGVSVSTLMDHEHAVTVTKTEKGKTLLAKDRNGDVLFDGPIDTDEQLQQVPQAIRDKMQRMNQPLNQWPKPGDAPKPKRDNRLAV